MNKRKGLSGLLSLVLTVALLGTALSVGLMPGIRAGAAVISATVRTLTADTLPEGTSLIEGKAPIDGPTDESRTAVNSGSLAALTDGKYPGINRTVSALRDGTTGEVLNVDDTKPHWGIQNNINDLVAVFSSGGYVDLTFDLVTDMSISSFTVGSTAEPASTTKVAVSGWTDQQITDWFTTHTQTYLRLHMGEFFVAGSTDALFTTATKVCSWDYTENKTVATSSAVTPLAAEYTLDTAATGRYVGFRIYDGSFGDTYGSKWYSRYRIGELAVYGSEPAYTATAITAKTDLPQGDSLIAGKSPLKADASAALPQTTNAAAMTDGRWQGLDDLVDFVTTTEQKTVSGQLAEAVPGQTGQYFDYETWGYSKTNANDTRALVKCFDPEVSFTFDMGYTALVSGIAIGSTTDLSAWRIGSAPVTEQALNSKRATYDKASFLRKGKVYVGADPATLYNAENLVLDLDYTANPAAALRNLYTFARAKEGQYVGFTFPTVSNLVRVSELAVYGQAKQPYTTTAITDKSQLPEGSGLLYGKSPLKADASAALPQTTNAAMMTDGRWQGLDDIVDFVTTTEQKTVSGQLAEAVPGQTGRYFDYEAWGYSKTNANDTRALVKCYDPEVSFTFDMGYKALVSQIAIGSGTDPAAWRIGSAPATETALNAMRTTYEKTSFLFEGKVYVGTDPATLYNAENLVLDLDYAADKAAALRNLYTFARAKEGQYVGFTFPTVSNLVRVSELAVYGTYTEPVPEKPYITTILIREGDLPVAENLLAGKAVSNKPTNWLVPTKADGVTVTVSGENGLDQLTDGKIYGINATDTNKCDITKAVNSGFVYDLRGSAEITSVMVAAACEADTAYRIPWLDVYAGDSLAAVFDGEAVARLDLRDSANILATLKQSVTARYIGFKAPQVGGWDIIRIGELGVYGTYAATPRGFDSPLIGGKNPLDAYLSWAGEPGNEMTGARMVIRDGELSAMTDGSTENRCVISAMDNTWYQEGFKLDTANDKGLSQRLEVNTPWIVMVYELGGTAKINTLTLTSGMDVGFQIAGADFYISEKIATLFDPANCVYSTGSTHTVENEYGEPVPDPAYDVTDRTIGCDLATQGGVQGRYVAFVITRAHPVNVKGFSLARIAELEVGGEMLSPEEPFDVSRQTLTDAATGIRAVISRVNPDDVAFFDGLTMEVTRSELPAGVATNIENNWLAVDSPVYTLTLKDKTGRILSDTDVGERYWEIAIPTAAGYYQIMGRIENGALGRIRNSATNAAGDRVLAGNDFGNADTIHGNALQLVLLKFNDFATISRLNNELAADGITVYSVQGATAVADNRLWLWALAAVLTAAAAAAGFGAWRLSRRARQ